jgi:hypothetical protein
VTLLSQATLHCLILRELRGYLLFNSKLNFEGMMFLFPELLYQLYRAVPKGFAKAIECHKIARYDYDCILKIVRAQIAAHRVTNQQALMLKFLAVM